jgi:hypothetical protein
MSIDELKIKGPPNPQSGWQDRQEKKQPVQYLEHRRNIEEHWVIDRQVTQPVRPSNGSRTPEPRDWSNDANLGMLRDMAHALEHEKPVYRLGPVRENSAEGERFHDRQ